MVLIMASISQEVRESPKEIKSPTIQGADQGLRFLRFMEKRRLSNLQTDSIVVCDIENCLKCKAKQINEEVVTVCEECKPDYSVSLEEYACNSKGKGMSKLFWFFVCILVGLVSIGVLIKIMSKKEEVRQDTKESGDYKKLREDRGDHMSTSSCDKPVEKLKEMVDLRSEPAWLVGRGSKNFIIKLSRNNSSLNIVGSGRDLMKSPEIKENGSRDSPSNPKNEPSLLLRKMESYGKVLSGSESPQFKYNHIDSRFNKKIKLETVQECEITNMPSERLMAD